VNRIIGLGNPRRGDDVAGVAVARLLRERRPEHAEIIECENDPVTLLDLWAEDDRVVVVDAVSTGNEPGTIHRFDALADPLPASLFPLSSHALGLVETIELGRALGRLPRSLVVYAVEGADFSTGQGLSPAIQSALSEVADRVFREVTSTPRRSPPAANGGSSP
jgi:hydrogenase maturation protease